MDLREVRVKRIIALVAVILAGIALLVISDTNASIADTAIPDNEVTSNQSGANNSSATATITITWTTVSLPGE